MATMLFRPTEKASQTCIKRSIDTGYLLYFYLHAAGFIATTLLITWGLFVLFFLAIGGFSLDGMMHQLDNLASRYVMADAARVDGFKYVVGVAHMLLAIAVIFFRRHSLLPPQALEGNARHG